MPKPLRCRTEMLSAQLYAQLYIQVSSVSLSLKHSEKFLFLYLLKINVFFR